MPLPPGTILQLMYLEERLRDTPPGRFIEIGPGGGEITNLLLKLGWQGQSVDLDETTVLRLENRFNVEVQQGRFLCRCADFLSLDERATADLVISCMVLEHLDDEEQSRFWRKTAEALDEGGIMIALVPASQSHWGIEDEIAGHYRRYDRAQVEAVAGSNNFDIAHMAGLTFPLSNWLLPISNYLVWRAEARHLDLSMEERTKLSGRREVSLKTTFPDIFSLVLNRFTLYPFYLLQKWSLRSKRALVIYFEAKPDA